MFITKMTIDMLRTFLWWLWLPLLIGWVPARSQHLIDFEDGLVGYYPFNGNADDKSGHGNDGIIKGATLTEDRFGQAHGAYRFDGRDQSLRIPYSATVDFSQRKSFTVSLWIRPKDANSGCLLFKNFDYGLKWGGLREVLTVYTGTGGGFIHAAFDQWELGAWYSLVLVQEEERLSLYINGKRNLSLPQPHQTAQQQQDIFIGGHPYYWGNFEGDIDDICLFDRALNELEIEAMYQIAKMPISVTPRDQGPRLEASMVAGDWQGIFSQPDNKKIDNYAYWLRLQVTGKQVEGFARIEIASTEAYGVMQVKGVLGEHALTFTETRTIREHNPTGLDWCKKFAKLRYDPDREALTGSWYADNCKNNGEVLVFRSQTPFHFHDRPVAEQSSLAELRRLLRQRQTESTAQTVSLVSRKIEIEPINFLTSSYQIDEASQQYLRSQIVPFLKEASSLRLMISGHTDNVGDSQQNLQLSIARAKAVVDLLVSAGISSSRLRYNGYGDSQPIASNGTWEGRKRNRRVEFEIVGE